jgi:hypothetical protein
MSIPIQLQSWQRRGLFKKQLAISYREHNFPEKYLEIRTNVLYNKQVQERISVYIYIGD